VTLRGDLPELDPPSRRARHRRHVGREVTASVFEDPLTWRRAVVDDGPSGQSPVLAKWPSARRELPYGDSGGPSEIRRAARHR
jgi:hypothetical protein